MTIFKHTVVDGYFALSRNRYGQLEYARLTSNLRLPSIPSWRKVSVGGKFSEKTFVPAFA